jgi:hypothetical protein
MLTPRLTTAYVATLAQDKASWVVDDSTRNVHRSENNTRIIKMTSMDGEYLLVGRQTVDTSNIFVQYGQGATRTVNMTGGQGMYVSFLVIFAPECSIKFGRFPWITSHSPFQFLRADSRLYSQQAEFIDGLRFSVQTNKSMTMNVDLKNGINPGTLPANTVSLNSYMWIVNTSDAFSPINAEMLVPCTFPSLPLSFLGDG